MKAVSFDSRICRDLNQALKKEWLETNGLGSVSYTTVPCAHTRRSQGLLTVPAKVPSRDYLLFSNLDETLYIDEAAYPLSTRLYEQTAYPEGFRHLNEFHLMPFPSWLFKIGDVILLKTVMMMHGEETVLIRYQLLGGNEVLTRLEVRPLVAERSAHSLQHRSPDFKPELILKPGQIRFTSSEKVPPLFFDHNAAIVDGTGAWYERIQYPIDRLSGLDCEEDLYAPFCLNFTFLRGLEVFLCASAAEKKDIHPELMIASEENRRRNLANGASRSDTRFQLLQRSAHSLFNQNSLHGSIAYDYPGFSDSLRETMLSFHGLLLTTGQWDRAKRLLIDSGKKIKNNFLAMDTPLWFIHRVFEYLKLSEDKQAVKTFFPAVQLIIESYRKGNEHFRMTSDALIESAASEIPLTWMDRKAGNTPVTPRVGKPVEIQALWYNALCQAAWMAGQLDLTQQKNTYEILAEQVKKSFNQIFWMGDSKEGYLADCVTGNENDKLFQPNQLLALGLTFPVLEENSVKWHSVLELTKKHLLTPYGLRSLAPHEPVYRGHLQGDRMRCEKSIHQGTVWTWLLLPYVTAVLRTSAASKSSKEEFASFFSPLWKRLETDCFGYIPEMFDGDFPHEARGSAVSASALGACLEIYALLKDVGKAPQEGHALTSR